MYADDVVLYFSTKNLINLIKLINIDLTLMYNWYVNNKLLVNIKKSQYIIFHSSHKSLPDNIPHILFGNIILEHTAKFRYLGIIFNENLKWNDYINSICSKVAISNGLLFRVYKIFDHKLLRTLYFALVHSYLVYVITIWGNAPLSILQPLICLQKKSIRIISKSNYLTHTAPLFIKFNIHNVINMHKYYTLLTMFKYFHHLTHTNIFSNMVPIVYLSNTRNAHTNNFFCTLCYY